MNIFHLKYRNYIYIPINENKDVFMSTYLLTNITFIILDLFVKEKFIIFDVV